MLFKNLSLKHKIALPIVLIIGVFAITFTMAIVAFNKQAEFNLTQSHTIKPIQMAMDDAYRDLYQAQVAIFGLANSPESAEQINHYVELYRDETKKTLKRIRSAQAAIDSGFLAATYQPKLDSALSLFEQWLALNELIVTSPTQANLLFEGQAETMHQVFTQLVANLKAIKDQIDDNALLLDSEKLAAIDSAKLTMEIGGAIALLIGVVVTLLQTKAIVAPIERINLIMQDIASGEGNLTVRLPEGGKDEMAKLAATFNTFVAKIQQTINDVIHASHEVRTEMSNFNQVTHQVMAMAQDQQQQSDAVATAVHELSATSVAVSDNANSAAKASHNANHDAETTKLTINQAIDSISALSSELNDASAVVTSLESDVANIASILDVIRGVAEQTNLLALNAAIEAARAGEQGRGFAVVADEVRSLASKTQHSAGEIQSMIENLQSGSNQAVIAMHSSQDNSENTVLKARQAGESLQAIVASIATIRDLNSQIAEAAQEQSGVSENVNANIQHIAQNGQQMVELVASADSAHRSLSTQCENLDYLVSQFKV